MSRAATAGSTGLNSPDSTPWRTMASKRIRYARFAARTACRKYSGSDSTSRKYSANMSAWSMIDCRCVAIALASRSRALPGLEAISSRRRA